MIIDSPHLQSSFLFLFSLPYINLLIHRYSKISKNIRAERLSTSFPRRPLEKRDNKRVEMCDAAATRSSFAIEIVKGGRLPASVWSDETAPLTDIARARVERVDNRPTFQASDEIREKRESEREKASQEIGEGSSTRGRRENWPKIVWIFGCFGDDVREGTTLFVLGAVASRRQASSQCAVKMPGWERVDRGWRASVVVVSTLRLPGRGKEADSDGSSKA